MCEVFATVSPTLKESNLQIIDYIGLDFFRVGETVANTSHIVADGGRPQD